MQMWLHMDKENVLMMAVEGLQDSEGLEDLVRSPRMHWATVSDAGFFQTHGRKRMQRVLD